MKKEVLTLLILVLSLAVYAQEFGVSPLKMNIMYMGVENPIKVVVENHDCDSILISSNVKLHKMRPCDYIAIPGNISVANFNLSVIKNNDTIRIGRSQFRVHKTPDPVISLGGRKEGAIPKGFLLSQPGIRAVLEYDFIFDAEYKIKSYTVVIERKDEKIFSKDYEGERFPAELKAEFSNAFLGDILRFENVVATGPEGSDRELAPASFKIN